MPPTRVLALGLSEASWSCIRTFGADLPNLTRMAARGASGVTVAPQPLTPEAMWGAVVGGASPVWRVLESAGVPTGTFNLKITPRPEAVSGFMIARDERPRAHRAHVHPPELYPRLRKQFGAWSASTRARSREEWRSVVPREIATRAGVLIELLRTRPWRFVLAQLPEVSRAQHRFWGTDDDTLRTIYAAADRAIGRVLHAAGPETTVFVFSECGAGPIRHAVQLNAWLEHEGYLHRRRGAAPAVVRSLARWYARARRLLPAAMPWSPLKAGVRAAEIDWSRTRAHSPANSGEIVVDGPARHELRDRLIALRDPEGQRVVEEVIVRGSRLTIVWDDDAYGRWTISRNATGCSSTGGRSRPTGPSPDRTAAKGSSWSAGRTSSRPTWGACRRPISPRPGSRCWA
jgi:predicted AlkP superfamily phosphohydrolase/phosphomutase